VCLKIFFCGIRNRKNLGSPGGMGRGKSVKTGVNLKIRGFKHQKQPGAVPPFVQSRALGGVLILRGEGCHVEIGGTGYLGNDR